MQFFVVSFFFESKKSNENSYAFSFHSNYHIIHFIENIETIYDMFVCTLNNEHNNKIHILYDSDTYVIPFKLFFYFCIYCFEIYIFFLFCMFMEIYLYMTLRFAFFSNHLVLC